MVLQTGGARLIPSGPATSSNRDGCTGWSSQTSSTAARPCTASGLCTTLAAAMPQHTHQQEHAVFTSPSFNYSPLAGTGQCPMPVSLTAAPDAANACIHEQSPRVHEGTIAEQPDMTSPAIYSRHLLSRWQHHMAAGPDKCGGLCGVVAHVDAGHGEVALPPGHMHGEAAAVHDAGRPVKVRAVAPPVREPLLLRLHLCTVMKTEVYRAASVPLQLPCQKANFQVSMQRVALLYTKQLPCQV